MPNAQNGHPCAHPTPSVEPSNCSNWMKILARPLVHYLYTDTYQTQKLRGVLSEVEKMTE